MLDDQNHTTPVHSAPSSAIRHSRHPSLGLEAISATGHGHAPLNKTVATHGSMLDRHTSSQWSVPFSNDSFLTSAATTITSESFALTHQGSSWWMPQTSVVFQQGGSNSPRGMYFPPGYYTGSPSPSSQHRSPQRGFAPAAVPLDMIPSISIDRGDGAGGVFYPTSSPRRSSSHLEHQSLPGELQASHSQSQFQPDRQDSGDGSVWGSSGPGMELAGTNVFMATAHYVDDQRGIRADASPTPIPSQAWSPSGTPHPAQLIHTASSSAIHTIQQPHFSFHQPQLSQQQHQATQQHQQHADPSSALFSSNAGRHQQQQLSRRNRASTMLPSANRVDRPDSPPPLQASQTVPLFQPSLGQEDSMSWAGPVVPSAPAAALSASKTSSGFSHAPQSAGGMNHVMCGPMTFADTLVRDLEWIRGQIDEHAAFVIHHSIHRAHRSAHALEPLSKSADSQMTQSRSNSPSSASAAGAFVGNSPSSVAQPHFSLDTRFSLSAMPSSSFAGQLHLSACELLRHGYHDIHHQQQPLTQNVNAASLGLPPKHHGQQAARIAFPGVVVLGAPQQQQLHHAAPSFTIHTAPPSAAPRSLLPPFTVATAIGGGLHSPEAMVLRRASGLLLIDAAWWLYHETIGHDEHKVSLLSAAAGAIPTDSTPSRHSASQNNTQQQSNVSPPGCDEGAATTARQEIESCLQAPSWSGETVKRIIGVSSAIEELGRRLSDAAGRKAPEDDDGLSNAVGGPVITRSVLQATETTRQYAMAQDVLFALAAQLPPLLASLERLFLSRRTSHVANVLMNRALLCIEERAALRRKRARMYDALEEGQGLVGDITAHLGVLEELRNNNLLLISDLQSALRDVMRAPMMLPNIFDSAPRLLQSSHAVAATHLTAAALRGIAPPHATSQKLRHMASTWYTLCDRRLNAPPTLAPLPSAVITTTIAGAHGLPTAAAPQHFILMIVAFPELQQVPVSVMSVLLQFLADAAGLPPPRHFICESHSYCGLWVPDALALAWATIVRSGSKAVFLRGYNIPPLILPFWGMLDALRLVLYLPSFHDASLGGGASSMALPGTCVQPTAVANFWQMHLSSRGGTSNLTLVANAIGVMVGARPEYVEHVGPSQALNVWVPLGGRDGWMQFGEGQLAFVDVASGELLALDASPASLMPNSSSLHSGHVPQQPQHHAMAAAAANGGFEVLMVARKRNRTRCGKETKKKGRPDEVRSATAV